MSNTNFVLLITYDMPTKTKQEQILYRKLNQFLQKSGFYLMQNSLYIKPLSEKHAKNKYINAIKKLCNELGHIRAITLTYQQFLDIDLVVGDNVWGEKLIKKQCSVITL